MRRLLAVAVGVTLAAGAGSACRGRRQAEGDAPQPAATASPTAEPVRGAGLGDAGVSARSQARDARQQLEEAERKAAEEAGVQTGPPPTEPAAPPQEQ